MSVYTKLDKIKAIVLDIDGVLTDNRILVTDNGEFLRTMNVRDGYAIKRALQAGLKIGIISGGRSMGTQKRLNILGITDIFLGIENKLEVLDKLASSWNIEKEDIAYMGDDIMDIACMKAVGLSCCPKDSVAEVLEFAEMISNRKGGDGCVRELIELILQSKGQW